MKMKIYILQLDQNKYYIGKSVIPDTRILDHFNSNDKAAAWTKIYKPIKVLEIYDNVSEFDEDNYTKKYMKIYGIDNV